MSVSEQLAPIVRAKATAQHLLAVKFVEADLDRRVPRAKGTLARSRRTSHSLGPSVLSSTIEYTAPQAAWTDEGTRAHTVVPVSRRVLRFKPSGRRASPVGSRSLRGRPRAGAAGYVFTMHARIPARRGTKWFRGAFTVARWRQFLDSASR